MYRAQFKNFFDLMNFFFNLFLIISFVEVCHSDLVLTGPVRTVVAHVAGSYCPRVYGQQNDYTWMEKRLTHMCPHIHTHQTRNCLSESKWVQQKS